MALSNKETYETISAAMQIIDPDGTVIVNSEQRQVVRENLVRRLETTPPEELLDQIRKSVKHHRAELSFMR